MSKINKVLLVADPQKGWGNRHTEPVMRKIEEIMPFFDKVFISQFVNDPNSLFQTHMEWNKFDREKDPESIELAIKLPEKNYKGVEDFIEIIQSSTYSKDFPEIYTYLNSTSTKFTYLAGFESDISVVNTAMNLWEKGILPISIKDACGNSGGKMPHAVGMCQLERETRCVFTMDQIKAAWKENKMFPELS